MKQAPGRYKEKLRVQSGPVEDVTIGKKITDVIEAVISPGRIREKGASEKGRARKNEGGGWSNGPLLAALVIGVFLLI